LKLATNNRSVYVSKLGVLLDFGRYSSRFDYLDGKNLGVEIGDIVLVTFKGNLCSGVVFEKIIIDPNTLNKKNDNKSTIKYLSIEQILQKEVFKLDWRNWLQDLAEIYKVSSSKMIKTAFPSGWIGKYKKNSTYFKSYIWISISKRNIPSNNKLTAKQYSLLNHIIQNNGVWQSDLIKAGFTTNLINRMCEKEFINKTKRNVSEKFDSPSHKYNPENTLIYNLTEQQKSALSIIKEMMPGDALLLWGETGSGKTEIYLRIVEIELFNNKSCLILAPEIGLIPQLVDRFRNRLGFDVYEYHSNCSDKYKKLVWNKLNINKSPVVVIGTRSAVFLPIRDLGLMILDEEHDNSYKQENPMPCYDAREVALDRAKKHKIKIIYGSATPSMNIWKKVYFEKNINIARMRDRISDTKIPEINIVDMREEFKKGNTKILSTKLLESLSLLREKGEQAIILVPRRGYSGFLSCRNCGYVVSCPNCDTSLTVHSGSKGTKWLSCHWCNLKRQFLTFCPECNSNAFKPFGIGTQKVVEFINNEIPNLRILRFDRDTTSGKDGHRKILNNFTKGNADVMVGTQMLAKGIDIPRVTLSVVLAADGLMHRPDLSSEEKSLQLFLQLAGRSGRAEKTGEVIFQTYQPNHPIINYLKTRDYEGFLIENSKIREKSNLFPFCKVILLRISGICNELTEETGNKLAEYLIPCCKEKNWFLIGPAPSLISKIGKKFRWQLLIYGPENTKTPLSNINKLWELIPNNIYLTIDTSPVEI
tara:strand:- start:430 stop:2706 length:2277 start_codon:yes stop_codon:yes gene_type:complete